MRVAIEFAQGIASDLLRGADATDKLGVRDPEGLAGIDIIYHWRDHSR
jgi:hypothetical protein